MGSPTEVSGGKGHTHELQGATVDLMVGLDGSCGFPNGSGLGVDPVPAVRAPALLGVAGKVALRAATVQTAVPPCSQRAPRQNRQRMIMLSLLHSCDDQAGCLPGFFLGRCCFRRQPTWGPLRVGGSHRTWLPYMSLATLSWRFSSPCVFLVWVVAQWAALLQQASPDAFLEGSFVVALAEAVGVKTRCGPEHLQG